MNGSNSTPRSSHSGRPASRTRKSARSSASVQTPAACAASGSSGEATAESRDVAARVERLPATKLDEARIERICAALREGQSRRCSALLAGVAQSTLFGWLAKGREAPDSIEGELLRRVAQAEAQCEAEHVENIRRAAMTDGQWTASAWWLERRDPEAWARKSRVQVEHGIAPALPDPSIGGRSMLMQQIVFNLNSNPDKETWPEPLRLAYEALTREAPEGAPTIDGDKPEQADAPAPTSRGQ